MHDRLNDSVRQLRRARADLLALEPAKRARALGRAAARLVPAEHPFRDDAVHAVSIRGGYSSEVAEAGLVRTFGAITTEALLAWWSRSGAPVDPPELAIVVSAGNVPVVGIFPMVASLLAGVPVLVKVHDDSAALVQGFIETLREVAPQLGEAASSETWAGGAGSGDGILDQAGRILVLGSDRTVDLLEERHPGRVRGYGAGLSMAFIGNDRIDAAAALALATDIAIWDQQGCLSPQAAWVQGSFEDTCRFGELLAEAMEEIGRTLPIGPLSIEEAGAVRLYRAEAEAAFVAGKRLRLWTPLSGIGWTVVADADPAFRSTPLNRTIRIHPISSATGLAPLLEPWRNSLQAAGVAGTETSFEAACRDLEMAGFGFLTSLGMMQAPPVDWPNKGRDLLQDILLERDAVPAARRRQG